MAACGNKDLQFGAGRAGARQDDDGGDFHREAESDREAMEKIVLRGGKVKQGPRGVLPDSAETHQKQSEREQQ